MRKRPETEPPELTRKKEPDRIIMERDYRLLTPLYGGGVEAGKVDTETPTHGTGIRGQLRFWWRATQAGRFTTVAEMKKAEDALWGSTTGGSAVSVAVIKAEPGKVIPPVQRINRKTGRPYLVYVGDPGSDYGYVAFPLRPTDERPEPGEVHEGASFTIEIAFPKNKSAELQAALWAWDTFGGVGARTRRGFGALHCREVRRRDGSAGFDPNNWRWEYDCNLIENALKTDVQTFVHEGAAPENVPKLSRNRKWYRVVRAEREKDSLATWTFLFGKLKDFRQNRKDNDRRQPFGRSRWPEPDAIRRITGQSLKVRKHNVPVHDNPVIDKFPRAVFGLPIIFAFHKDQKHPSDRDRDPRDTKLSGVKYDRLASPLILRPVACQGGRFRGLAVVLDTPRIPEGGLQLTGTGLAVSVQAQLTEDEADQIDAEFIKEGGKPTITEHILLSFLDSLN